MKKKIVLLLAHMLLLSTFAIVFPVENVKATGNTIYVDDSGGANYTSIQDGIDAASSGDTIYVFSGNYYENIVIDKTIDLIGEDEDNTIVDGGGIDSTVIITANSVTMRNFKILNAGTSSEPQRSGIELNNVEFCSISNNNVQNNRQRGISLVNSNHNIVTNNTCSDNSGEGIALWSRQGYTTSNNLISNNICNSNGRSGILSWSYTSDYITSKENDFIGNDCHLNGRAGIEIGKSINNVLRGNDCSHHNWWEILIDDSNNNILSNNNCSYGREGLSICGDYNTISICSFINNNRGMFISGSNNIIYHNNFVNNIDENAYDEGDNNIWDNGYPSGGNYWDDYTGVDGFVLSWGSQGSGDGQFNSLHGIAVDVSGDIYVVEYPNNRIQKFTSDGTFITKWGSTGSDDGQFKNPEGIAVDTSGNVYVADKENHRVQKFTSDGTFITKWGSQGSGDGQFAYPFDIAIDSSDNVYVMDYFNHRVQKFTSDGTFITKWGSRGYGDGQFYYPIGIAVDASSNVYVTNDNNNRVQKYTGDGAFITKWGSLGSGDGRFYNPEGIAVDTSGNVYVADLDNHRIQKFTEDGTFITKWGSQGSGDGQFNYPNGIAVDASGNIYVADNHNYRVQKFTSDGGVGDQLDTDGDGIGDTPYDIPGGDNEDRYPFMNQNGWIQPPNQPPTADFSWSSNSLVVDFTDTSTDSDGTIVSWSWTFGDDYTSTEQNPSHTYANSGTYSVILTVTDNDGATDSKTAIVTVSQSPSNYAPTANFSWDADDLEVDFTDTSTDSDGIIVDWSWDFGDGVTSTLQNSTHQYSTADTYTVTLTVTDDDGATGNYSLAITVSSAGLTSHAPIYINGNSDFTSANGVSSGSGTQADPYIIENWDINASTATGIYIRNTDVYFIIRNCIIHNGKSNVKHGIYFYSITNGKIDNMTSYNNYRGIYLYHFSNNNTILNCTVYNSHIGIYLSGYGSECNYNQITNCTVYNNNWGIYLNDYSDNNIVTNCNVYNNILGIRVKWHSDNNIVTNCNVYNNSCGVDLGRSFNNQITNCDVYNNDGSGIVLSGTSSNNNQIINCDVYNNVDGIKLDGFSNNDITNCTVYNNSNSGIYLWCSSNSNTITYCNITDNTNYGVYIGYYAKFPSNYNTFHHNNFINNAQNAYDPHTNYWDDGTEGNYWDNYIGIDADDNGIGDTPYDIPGGDNQDRYPFPFVDSNNLPTADFSWASNDLEVDFTDTSTDSDGTIVSWSWTFGDGVTSTSQNPTHQYSTADTYTVMLTVTDNDGATDSKTAIVTVSQSPSNYAPTANFSWDADGLEVDFTDTSTDSESINQTIKIKSLIDGRSQLIIKGNTVQWYHIDYAAPGRHLGADEPTYINGIAWMPWSEPGELRECNCYSLVYESPTSLLPEKDVTIELNIIESRWETQIIQYPSADNSHTLIIEFDDNPPSGHDWYEVEVQVYNAGDGIIVDWSWDFGDGETSTEQNPSHTYANSGTYSVTLTVTDNDGATDSETANVTVSQSPSNYAPTADFSWISDNLRVDFTDTSTDSDGTIVSWSWTFGDDYTSTEQNPSHTFASSGGYSVTLTVTDNDDATDTIQKNIGVSSPIIIAIIDIDPNTLNLNSNGKWITCYIELPDGYNVTDINVSTLMLNDQVQAETSPTEIDDYDNDAIPDLKVKFDRSDVAQILNVGDNVEITITGELTNGTTFEGSDTIKVINNGGGNSNNANSGGGAANNGGGNSNNANSGGGASGGNGANSSSNVNNTSTEETDNTTISENNDDATTTEEDNDNSGAGNQVKTNSRNIFRSFQNFIKRFPALERLFSRHPVLSRILNL